MLFRSSISVIFCAGNMLVYFLFIKEPFISFILSILLLIACFASYVYLVSIRNHYVFLEREGIFKQPDDLRDYMQMFKKSVLASKKYHISITPGSLSERLEALLLAQLFKKGAIDEKSILYLKSDVFRNRVEQHELRQSTKNVLTFYIYLSFISLSAIGSFAASTDSSLVIVPLYLCIISFRFVILYFNRNNIDAFVRKVRITSPILPVSLLIASVACYTKRFEISESMLLSLAVIAGSVGFEWLIVSMAKKVAPLTFADPSGETHIIKNEMMFQDAYAILNAYQRNIEYSEEDGWD